MARNVFLDKETKLRQSRLLPEMASSTSKCSTELLCEFNSEWSQSSDITIPRTPTLILDYVQFLAARTIQRHWRGFSSRKSEVDTKKAAITIQRWWRGYQVRGKYMLIMERMLQDRLMDMYNNAATKIQALFRGWWSRQAVHDLSALKRIQRCAAQDLLNCVAYKLHHLLRTHSIPGVYSLRDSNCLSRVEKLLSTMTFRFYNARVHNVLMKRERNFKNFRRNFTKNSNYTTVPYTGPNDKVTCKPHCEDFLSKTINTDKLMYKIIAAYDDAQRDLTAKKTQYNLAERKRRKHIDKILEQKERRKCSFCVDVVASMRRWKIWDSEKLTISKDVFRNLGNLESFLNEAKDIVDDFQGRCHCKIMLHDMEECH
ncbi:uncharacterized protein LOC133843424 isoform X1 [Drosophila sulfurigaster albostrigata]|uniref:uncharacterized protein LOC133843424 isoform X1 n=1 Tax=Drosophila sulfurigaster albostrigata TaxID=89887 RepID=UPI002D21BAEF|nr:uncharacterized protein LOC133843424 isoform X1 [Drosophila sulfurigaster albostrigata]